jgi:hypothetical protein
MTSHLCVQTAADVCDVNVSTQVDCPRRLIRSRLHLWGQESQ